MMQVSIYELSYVHLVKRILAQESLRQTRNAKTKSIFGAVLEVDCQSLPLLCGRRLYPRGVIGELAAMLKGPKTLEDFEAHGCNYWKAWAKEDGTINVDYGNAWLDFNGVNQLKELVEGLKKDPYGRRHIVTGWRPDHLKNLSLPCCHLLYQWYVRDNVLDMIWYQRSVDVMVGLPSDVILAWVWNYLVANECGLLPGKITMMLGDSHVYEPHLDQALVYIQNVRDMQKRLTQFAYPEVLPVKGTMFDFDHRAVEWPGYNPVETLKFELLA